MNFKESFLHFIWKFQLFDKSFLATTNNDVLHILNQGQHNTNAGPDFLDSKISISKVKWFGAIEIHIHATDWQKHAHHLDKAYEQVVLHVVWNEDAKLIRNDGSPMPTLTLKDKVDKVYIDRYQSLIEYKQEISCTPFFDQVSMIVKRSMFDRVLLNRQEHKAEAINEIWKASNGSWEDTAYKLLAKNFGFKVNAFPFQKLAEKIPLKILQKHSDNLFQLEALLFGVAGFLKEVADNDEYAIKLQNEYLFLGHKYDLLRHEFSLHEWKYLRLRPANFPTIRIAQFAMLLYQQSNLYSFLTSFEDYHVLEKQLSVTQSRYWQQHFKFNVLSFSPIGSLGKSSVENIMINSVVPLLFAVSKFKNEQIFTEKAITLLEELPAEQNAVTAIWSAIGFELNDAFDSQAAIELYSNYCSPKKCLDCAIGAAIMKTNNH